MRRSKLSGRLRVRTHRPLTFASCLCLFIQKKRTMERKEAKSLSKDEEREGRREKRGGEGDGGEGG